MRPGLAIILLMVGGTLHSVAGQASDCWQAGPVSGWSATAFNDYDFEEDSHGQGMVICFTEGSGTVSGSDLDIVRIADSTLLGVGGGSGSEVVNTWQIDRHRRKLLFTQSRIGTAALTSFLPDYAAVFVADVVPVIP